MIQNGADATLNQALIANSTSLYSYTRYSETAIQM